MRKEVKDEIYPLGKMAMLYNVSRDFLYRQIKKNNLHPLHDTRNDGRCTWLRKKEVESVVGSYNRNHSRAQKLQVLNNFG